MSKAQTGKNMSAALWESRERFRNLIAHMPDPVRLYDLDSKGRLLFVGANPAADALFEMDHHLVIGTSVEEAFPHFCGTELPRRYMQVIRQGKPWENRAFFYKDQKLVGLFKIKAFPIAPRSMATVFQLVHSATLPRRELPGEPLVNLEQTSMDPILEIHISKGEGQRIAERQWAKRKIQSEPSSSNGRVVKLDQLTFTDLFTVEELQAIQDAFASATNMGSIICDPDGRPITRPSNFCRLCRDIIRCTPKGASNCMASDALIGRPNPSGPVMRVCLSGGLWDGGASICVGDKHIASWLVGQVRDDSLSDDQMLAYAREIGADEEEFMSALAEVPRISRKQFDDVCHALFLIANQMSELALQNVLQARSIVARQQAEAELRRSRARLHRLSAKLIMAQEEERRQLAVELHDGIGQSLTAAKYCVDNVRQVLAQGGSATEALESAANVLKTSIGDVRRMQAALRPKMLDEMGVIATLNWFCREYQSIYQGIRLRPVLEAPEPEIPAMLKPVVFRVTQEALNNAAKHSRASTVDLTLRKEERSLTLTVMDNGVGFNLEQVEENPDWRCGLGLDSMRERTELLGGNFKIDTGPGLGTRINARWPL